MSTLHSDPQVTAVRRFTRFYTRRIDVVRPDLHGSPWSLTEARILYELAQRDDLTAGEIARNLGIDPGHLSRMLARFARAGLIRRRRSPEDGRVSLITLTQAGRAAFAPLDEASERQAAALLESLSPAERVRLVTAMATVETLLGERGQGSLLLRPPRPGDMGWVVERHGALYAEEYGFDASFEALVAEIVADYLRNNDPRRDCCLIAEIDGAPVGSCFLVHDTQTRAKIRLVLVEPTARGRGVGRSLLEECLRFARAAGYVEVVLWTQSILLAARKLYASAGFRLVKEEPHRSFGRDLVGETWQLDLRPA